MLLLDSVCTSTVSGANWSTCYLESLPDDQLKQVNCTPTRKLSKFGGGETKVSFECLMAGQSIGIRTDVVDSEIPLLLSKEAMKKATSNFILKIIKLLFSVNW